MKKALNDQTALEANASNTYLAMASWCEITGYEGSAAFFYVQAEDERQHMLKFIHYLNDMGVSATIPGTKSPSSNYKSLETIIKTALNNEYQLEYADFFERAWLLLADFFISNNKYDLAEEQLGKCLKYNKSMVKAEEYMGLIKEKERMYVDAAEHYEKAW